jgi:dTDP-glucose pyrophosphorylase
LKVKLAETDRQKFASSHNNRHFEATRMLYGTSTAPAAFARIMNLIYWDNDNFIVYLDDQIIVTTTFEEHVKALKFICRSHGIFLSAKKCNLFATEIDFLRHNISKAGVRPMQKHKTAIGMFPRPHDRQSLKSFCGMANYNSRYVQGSSIIMSPLHKLCSSRNDFEWTEDNKNAFLSTKKNWQNQMHYFTVTAN